MGRVFLSRRPWNSRSGSTRPGTGSSGHRKAEQAAELLRETRARSLLTQPCLDRAPLWCRVDGVPGDGPGHRHDELLIADSPVFREPLVHGVHFQADATFSVATALQPDRNVLLASQRRKCGSTSTAEVPCTTSAAIQATVDQYDRATRPTRWVGVQIAWVTEALLDGTGEPERGLLALAVNCAAPRRT